MKRIIGYLLLLTICLSQQLAAQRDSIKTVELDVVTVTGQGKKSPQLLLHFYKANANATLEDILARLPEISMVRRGSYGMEPTIRSMNGGQVNVLIDGMKLHGACTDKMDPATIYIEPINLENIQLQTGISGFSKGAAIGGTLDMKIATPKYLNEGSLHGRLQSGFQSVSNGWYQAAVLNYNKGRLALRGSGTYRSHHNYKDGNRQEVHFSQYHKTNLSLAANYQLNEQTNLKADMLTDDGWNMGYAALPMDVGFAKARLFSMSVNHNNANKKWHRWNARVYANDIRHSMDDTKRPQVPIHMDMPGHSRTAGFFGEAAYIINHKQSIQCRLDGASSFLKASMTMYPPGETPMYMLTWPNNRRNQLGMSVQWQWQPDSLYTLRLLARVDGVQSKLTSEEAKAYVAITGGNTDGCFDLLKSISATVNKRIGQNWQLNLGTGYGQGMPTASELYGFYLYNAADNYDYIGNTWLRTENAINAEASLVWTTKAVKLQLAVFYTHMQHYLVGLVDSSLSAMTIGAKGVKVYKNLENAHLAGTEMMLQWKPNTSVALTNTLRYTTAASRQGQPLPFIAPLKNVTSVRYAHQRVWLQLEGEIASAQYRISQAAGERNTPGYALVHLRMGYQLPSCNEIFSLQLGVENMLNTAYREHLDWGSVLRPGRNLYMQVNCSF